MESTIKKQIKVIQKEYEESCNEDDDWRLKQLDKYFANPKHPYSKYRYGNQQTLETVPKKKKINVRQELLTFYKTWYSGNLMALTVLGKGK